MIKGEEDADTRSHAQGETEDFISLHKTPTVGMKLNRGDI
jgi:hypothetical protein